MRKVEPIIIIIFVTIFLVTLASFVTAQSYDLTVEGQNNPEQDIKAIQEAVDKGGAILLKGEFDFGEKGQVKIKNDIEINGELDDKGSHKTKVKGGFWSFHSPLPSTELPLPGPGPKVTIKNIHFDGAVWSPIYFAYTSGAEISGNKINNVKPSAVSYKWHGGDTLLLSAGVILGTRFAHREKILPGAVKGHLIVEDNSIDLKCKNPEITMGQGVFFIWTSGATIEIKKNKIRNVSRNSIESLDNYLDEEGKGSVLIAENNIVTPSVGITFPGPSTPNGIVVGWFLDKSGGSDPSRNSKITVVRNYVQTNGDTSGGIISLSDVIAIMGNRVEVKGGSKSSGILQIGSNGFIAKNKIDGSGAFALRAIPHEDVKTNGNTFAWNDLKDFNPSSADFQCIGNKNILIGAKCKVDDKGKWNKILTMH